MAALEKEYALSMLFTRGSNITYNHVSIFKLRISNRRRHFLCHRLKGWKAQSHRESCWLEFGLHRHREAAAQAPHNLWTVKHLCDCSRGMQGWEGRGERLQTKGWRKEIHLWPGLGNTASLCSLLLKE